MRLSPPTTHGRLAATVCLCALLAWGAGAAHAGEYKGDAAASAQHYLEGELAAQAWRWKQAADAFWAAIDADHSNYDAHVRYQEASARNGVAKADVVADYDSFATDFPDVFAFKLHRLRLEEPKERLDALTDLAKKRGKDGELLFEIGRVQLELGDAGKAVKALEDAAKAFGAERLDLLVLLARADVAAGKPETAEKRFAAVSPELKADARFQLAAARLALETGKFDKAAEGAQAVAAAWPGSTAAALVLAEAQQRQGKLDEALATLTAARRTTEDALSVVLALADLVGRTDQEKALDVSGVTYDEALAAAPEEVRALYGQAWVREREEKYKEAETLYRRVATLVPTSPAVVHSIGFVLFKQGRVSDAQVQFRKAIDMDPSFLPAYANMGATHDSKAEYSDAIKWYEKLLKVKGQQENFRALINCAFDYEQLGTFPKAEDYLRRARKQRPKDANIAVWLADNLYFQEKWKEAERTYQEAIDLDRKSFFAWRGLGLTLGQIERWADAVAALEEARKLKPDDLDVLLTLGGIYLQELEDLEKALDALQEYVQRGGDDPAVRDVIVEIRKQLEKKR